MANIQIIQGDFKKKLKLPIAEGLKAGFPSPAEDYSHETLDFNRDLIRNHRKDGYIELRPANKDFKPIRIDADDDFEVWGVVIWTIKKWR